MAKTSMAAALTSDEGLARHPNDRPLGGFPGERAVEGIALDRIDMGPNVRDVVGEDLEGLAQSIREHGVLQPVKVARAPGGRYTLLWGQRRVLAARLAGLEAIPAVVEQWRPDATALQLEQLVENLQRADMAPLEEAAALQAVIEAWPTLTHEQLGAKLGRSRAWVSNSLRLLEAPEAVRAALEQGKVSGTAARAAIGLSEGDATIWLRAAEQRGLNARQLEEEAAYLKRTADDREARKRQEEERWRARVAEVRQLGATATSLIVCTDPAGRVLLEADGLSAVAERPQGWSVYTEPGPGCCNAFEMIGWGTPYRACVDPAHVAERRRARDAGAAALQAEREARAAEVQKEKEQLRKRLRGWLGTLSSDDLVRAWALDQAIQQYNLNALAEELSICEEGEHPSDEDTIRAIWEDPLFTAEFAREWLTAGDCELAVLAS